VVNEFLNSDTSQDIVAVEYGRVLGYPKKRMRDYRIDLRMAGYWNTPKNREIIPK